MNAKCEICNSNNNIEFDHIDPMLKIYRLADYSWWKWHGGTDGMKEELKKCRLCHDKQETSYKRKFENIQSMPNATKVEKIMQMQAKHRYKKRRYNTILKLSREKCQYCEMEVTEDSAVSFHWAHIDVRNKSCNISDLWR